MTTHSHTFGAVVVAGYNGRSVVKTPAGAVLGCRPAGCNFARAARSR